ncbi:hypothetical protein F4604DRAFT_1923142 [Suillus subluteus]|nr:hypothetical protein F4604DRAFT_1923142 [Suillus subluteus]
MPSTIMVIVVAQTVAPTIKLGSFPAAPQKHNVSTMDLLTSKELDRLVSYETTETSLGHFLLLIFKSFRLNDVPRARDLQIKLGKLRCNSIAKVHFQGQKEDEMVPLYDSQVMRWNWDFPVSSVTPAGARERNEFSFTVHLNVISEIWYSNFSTKAVQSQDIMRKPDLVLSDHIIDLGWNNILLCAELTFSDYSSAGCLGNSIDTKAYLLMREQPWWRFILFLSFSKSYHELHVHLYDRSGGLVSPTFNIDRDADAYLQILGAVVFGSSECLGYDQTIVFYVTPSTHASSSHRTAVPHKAITCDGTQENGIVEEANLVTNLEEGVSKEKSEIGPNVVEASCPSSGDCNHSVAGHTDDSGYVTHTMESHEIEEHNSHLEGLSHLEGPSHLDPVFTSTGVLPSETHPDEDEQDVPTSLFPPPPSNKDPIGKIRGFTGQGTVCYLVKFVDQEFIVKDHWVLGQELEDVLNEVEMLKRMQGIAGVPWLVDYWVVERGDQTQDQTSHLRFTDFQSMSKSYRTHRELVTALRDIVSIIHAASKCNVVHRDCSLHNTMIEDLKGAIRGCLIDWEFAIHAPSTPPSDNERILTRGGTGMIPFMSCKLLSQLVDADMANWSVTTSNHSHKRASGTTPKTLPTIEQGYADDLESVLWVFLWVLLNYSGPLGMEWGKKGLMTEGWINLDTTTCIGAKYVLFRSGKATFLSQIHPYFKDLMALADTWLEIMQHNDKEPYQADEFSPERHISSQALKLPLGQDVEMKRKRIVVPESEGTYLSKKLREGYLDYLVPFVLA